MTLYYCKYSVMAEEKVLEFDSRVLSLNLEELIELCEQMKIDKNLTDGKTKLVIVKVIRSTMEEDLTKLDEDESIRQYLDPNVEFLANISKKKNVEASMSKKLPVEPSSDVSASKLIDLSCLPRRDFKIIGQIGDPGHKDKLLYHSLVSQIQNGLKKGYTDDEVVIAVVRAIQAGIPLRAYLESIPDLTLTKLRKILRCHYQEKTATELYQILTNLTQQQKEDPQSFLVRALTVRQQISFVSQEANSQIKYDNTLVQGLFLHAIETGLADETVRSKVRPLLDPNASDEDLLEGMGKAMAEENEREKKLSRGKLKVAAVGTDKGAIPDREEAEQAKTQQDHVWAALKSVQSQLEAAITDVNSSRCLYQQPAKPMWVPPFQEIRYY